MRLKIDSGGLLAAAVLAFIVGVCAGLMLAKPDVLAAHEEGKRQGDYDGYWRAKGEHGIY